VARKRGIEGRAGVKGGGGGARERREGVGREELWGEGKVGDGGGGKGE